MCLTLFEVLWFWSGWTKFDIVFFNMKITMIVKWKRFCRSGKQIMVHRYLTLLDMGARSFWPGITRMMTWNVWCTNTCPFDICPVDFGQVDICKFFFTGFYIWHSPVPRNIFHWDFPLFRLSLMALNFKGNGISSTFQKSVFIHTMSTSKI